MDAIRTTLRRYLVDEPYRRLPPDELWSRFRDHRDEAAFRVLLERVGGRVYSRCRAVLRDSSSAEDAFQEAFGSWVRCREKLPTYPAAVAWLYRTATNTAKVHRRKWFRVRRRETAAAITISSACHPMYDPEFREQSAMVSVALVRLPIRERQAVELVYLEGLTHEQTATALGLSRGSVATYLRRGLDRLRRTLSGKAGFGAGGMVAVQAALHANSATGLPPHLAATVSKADWTKAINPPAWAGGWLPLKAVAASVIVGGGLAVVLSWNGHPVPETPSPPTSAKASDESVPDRNLRTFMAEVLPEILTDLRPLALGNGKVELETVYTYDTRLDCQFVLRHRLDKAAWVSRLHFIHDTYNGRTACFFDPDGRNKWMSVDTRRPIILWRNPVTRAELVLPVPQLEAARGAFGRLPTDTRTEAVREAHVLKMARAITPYLGKWYAAGDPTHGINVEINTEYGWVCVVGPGDQRRDEHYEAWGGDASYFEQARWLRGNVSAVLSDGGRRLVFPDTGEWWSRETRQ